MGTPESFAIISWVAAAMAVGLATILLARGRPVPFARSVATLVFVTAIILIADGLSLVRAQETVSWRLGALVGELVQASALLYVGLSIMQPVDPREAKGIAWRAHAVLGLALLFAALAWLQPARVMTVAGSDNMIMLGSLGRVFYVFVLLVMALGLTQVEQIFRSSSDPLRFQLKYVLIGVGALAGYQVYQASRLLLLPVWRPEHVLVGALTTVLSVALIGFGFARSRLRNLAESIYISHQVVYGSLSFLVIGTYLVLVGVLGEWIRRSEQPISVGLGTFGIFCAMLLLVIAITSRSARAEFRRFVSKHVRRAKYDYRAKWLEVVDALGGAASVDDILDQFLRVLSRTFGAARISIWMRIEADGRFHQIRSVNTLATPPPLDETHPLVSWLREREEPTDPTSIEPGKMEDAVGWRAFRDATHAALCAPVGSRGEVLAFVTLGPELHGERYGRDDRDLLRSICHHVGVLLAHARLAEERREAAELEALHRFSAFCLHDLKNLTARLSLVVQNAKVYGEDPVFWRSAIGTVGRTVNMMMVLMAKLRDHRFDEGTRETVDVNTVLDETIGTLGSSLTVPVKACANPVARVWFARDQLHRVLQNLLLNAEQSIQGGSTDRSEERGQIHIVTEQVNRTVLITVTDNGPGIPGAELRTLFRPFKSSKTGGLGIGLYQCKRMIEAHNGAFRVESEEGRGTQARIRLPVAELDQAGQGAGGEGKNIRTAKA